MGRQADFLIITGSDHDNMKTFTLHVLDGFSSDASVDDKEHQQIYN